MTERGLVGRPNRISPSIALTVAMTLIVVVGASPGEGMGTGTAPALTTFRYDEAGFQLALGDEWRLTSGSDRTTLTATRFDLRLFVTSGDEQGRVARCDFPVGTWEDCDPIRPSGLNDLAASLVAGTPAKGEHREVTGRASSTLDGERAASVKIRAGAPQRPVTVVEYWVAIHEERPFVIRFWSRTPAALADVDAVLSGFSFLPAESASGDPDVWVPDSWTEVERPMRGVRAFVVADRRLSRPAMTIAVEGDDGVLDLCVIRCSSFPGVDSIADLEAALRDPAVLWAPVKSPYGPRTPRISWRIEREDVMLGGQPARLERPIPTQAEWTMSGAYEHVLAVHDGRAIVLSFDFTLMRVGVIPDAVIEEILARLRFTD